MFENQKALPCCQYGVPASYNEEGVDDCGQAAEFVWNWGDGDFYVCAEHNTIVEESENESQVV